MLEKKLQFTVVFEDGEDLKKKNYTHAIADDATAASLSAVKKALASILYEEVRAYAIDKTQVQ